jgi:hypothetical protein
LVATRRQVKLALLQIGLLDTVEAAVAASGDRAMQISYADALELAGVGRLYQEFEVLKARLTADCDTAARRATSIEVTWALTAGPAASDTNRSAYACTVEPDTDAGHQGFPVDAVVRPT